MQIRQGIQKRLQEIQEQEQRRKVWRPLAWVGGSIGTVVAVVVLLLCFVHSQYFWNVIVPANNQRLVTGHTTPNLQTSLSADDVRWVYVTPPLPTPTASQPLFPDWDRDKIEQLLQWIQQAKEVPQGNLTMPRRSTELHVAMKKGQTLDVSPAWTCTQSKAANGSFSSICHTVTNRMILVTGNGKPLYVSSPELYAFMTNGYRDWMPQIPMDSYPAEVQAGHSYQVTGQAWLSQKVTLSFKNGEQVMWSVQVVPDHGAFTKQITIPHVGPGVYDLEYKGDQQTVSLPIMVVK